MATKTITITQGAYEKLKIRKRGNESFSDVINKIAPYTDWEDFVGILSKKSAEKLRKSVEESRKSWSKTSAEIERKLKGVKVDSRY